MEQVKWPWKNCSAWVDGPPCCPDLWADCCRRHDEPSDPWQWPGEDIELARCVNASSYSAHLDGHPLQRAVTRYIMPGLMWAGLTVFGYAWRGLDKIFKLGW